MKWLFRIIVALCLVASLAVCVNANKPGNGGHISLVMLDSHGWASILLPDSILTVKARAGHPDVEARQFGRSVVFYSTKVRDKKITVFLEYTKKKKK